MCKSVKAASLAVLGESGASSSKYIISSIIVNKRLVLKNDD